MNPYPFVGLNHFTAPVAISVSNVDCAQYGSRLGATRAAIGLPSGVVRRTDRKRGAVRLSPQFVKRRLDVVGIRVRRAHPKVMSKGTARGLDVGTRYDQTYHVLNMAYVDSHTNEGL